MEFTFSAGFFVKSSVEEEFDLFIQRPMLSFSELGQFRF